MIRKDKKRITITIDKELDSILNLICSRCQATKSEFISTLIVDFIVESRNECAKKEKEKEESKKLI